MGNIIVSGKNQLLQERKMYVCHGYTDHLELMDQLHI